MAGGAVQCDDGHGMLVLGILLWAGLNDLHAGKSGSVEMELPRMLVEATADELPWRYGRNDGVEVLTLGSEEMTSVVIKAATRTRVFLPEDFQKTGSQPLRFILFDEAIPHYAPIPILKVPIPEGRFGAGWVRFTNTIRRPDGISAANLFGVSDWPELHMDLAAHYFDNCRPVPPPWLREGLLGSEGALSSLAGYRKLRRMVSLGAFAWDRVAEVRAIMEEEGNGHGIYPLRELFESPPPDDPELRWRWALQAALFCRWQIYSPEGKRNGGQGFWNWARLARKEPVNEMSFESCVGFDYAEAEVRMLKYLQRHLGVPVDVPIRLYPLANEPSLRPATETEIARLLGAYQWQEAKRLVEEGNPEQAWNYQLAARRTYQRGLKRTGGHAVLHVGLGLLEYEAGCADEARLHLEKAFVGKGSDARALLALARLRFVEASQTVDEEGLLTVDQIGHVLTPLFAARSEVPVDVAVYRLIGEVWARSAITAEARHLNVLLEGVRSHPHDLELALQVAEVHVRHGHREIARVVAQRGEALAGRSGHRSIFETFLARLERP